MFGSVRFPGLASQPGSARFPALTRMSSSPGPANATLPQHSRGLADFERVPTRTTTFFPAIDLGLGLPTRFANRSRYPPRIDQPIRKPACLSSAPRPSDRPEGRPDFCGRHRGPGPAFKGLSYVGIRASIRRLLPRRLEPILSWVFTSLGFSPFLPRPRRSRGLLSRT